MGVLSSVLNGNYLEAGIQMVQGPDAQQRLDKERHENNQIITDKEAQGLLNGARKHDETLNLTPRENGNFDFVIQQRNGTTVYADNMRLSADAIALFEQAGVLPVHPSTTASAHAPAPTTPAARAEPSAVAPAPALQTAATDKPTPSINYDIVNLLGDSGVTSTKEVPATAAKPADVPNKPSVLFTEAFKNGVGGNPTQSPSAPDAARVESGAVTPKPAPEAVAVAKPAHAAVENDLTDFNTVARTAQDSASLNKLFLKTLSPEGRDELHQLAESMKKQVTGGKDHPAGDPAPAPVTINGRGDASAGRPV